MPLNAHLTQLAAVVSHAPFRDDPSIAGAAVVLILAGLYGAVKGPNWRWAGVAGVIMGISLLVGHP